MRDVMDGMEALASLFAYRQLPEDLEILAVEAEPEVAIPSPPPRRAEVIDMGDFRPPRAPKSPLPETSSPPHLSGKNKKIIML